MRKWLRLFPRIARVITKAALRFCNDVKLTQVLFLRSKSECEIISVGFITTAVPNQNHR